MIDILYNLIKTDFERFVNTATEDVVKRVVSYDKNNAYSWLLALRNKTRAVTFLREFPSQQTSIPYVCFVLENKMNDVAEQSFSLDLKEATDSEVLLFAEILKAFKGSTPDPEARVWISNNSNLISCAELNRASLYWLTDIIETIIRINYSLLAAKGFIKLGFSQTELRLFRELVPPDAYSKVFRITYNMNELIPLYSTQGAPFGDFEFDYE